MSNPAVIKLQRKDIYNQDVWLDDNFGESIHLHIDNWRVDLTNDEFDNMCSDICDALNEMIDIEGFDTHNISSVYLEQMLYKGLPYITKTKIDNVKLEDLICPKNDKYIPLKESRCVKALNGDNQGNNSYITDSDLNGQTAESRLDQMLESIKTYGYPYKDEYIVLYNDEMIIRDGQHRAACLYHLYGNKEIPVLRLYFKDNSFYEFDAANTSALGRFKNIISSPKNLYDFLYRKARLIKHKLVAIKFKGYLNKNKEEIEAINKVFENR